MVTKVHHALTRADYYAEAPDSIRVVDGDTWGRFTRTGLWLEGELKQCDPQMCRWLGGELLVRQQAEQAAKVKEGGK